MDIKNSIIPARILGSGYADENKDERFSFPTQLEFIEQYLSDEGRKKLCTPKEAEKVREDNPSSEELMAKATKAIGQTGFDRRSFFKGTVMELALMAAIDCLERAGVKASQLDGIIGATNTGPDYPSLADYIKAGLAEGTSSWIAGESNAACSDETEACASGLKAIETAVCQINSGRRKMVLVVAAEKATELAEIDDWQSSNLFGDGAGAILIGVDEKEHLIASKIISDPYREKIGYIKKQTLENGKKAFTQLGNRVHKFVGRAVSDALLQTIKEAGLTEEKIDVVSHQPSGKTVELLKKELGKVCPNCTLHIDLSTGNISSASTLRLFAKLTKEGILVPGQKVVFVAFGAGITIIVLIFEI